MQILSWTGVIAGTAVGLAATYAIYLTNSPLKFDQLNLSWTFVLGGTAASLVASFVVYKTVVIYAKRKRYSHIPGPETRGFARYFILKN